MTDSNYLPVFSGWLVGLGEDVLSLANLLESPEVRPRWRRASAEALESLLRASDLIPEGLENLGYLEQAFVLRLLAQRALAGADDLESENLEPEARARAGVSEVVEVLRGELDEAPEVFDELDGAPAGADGELETGSEEPASEPEATDVEALDAPESSFEMLEAPALEETEASESFIEALEAPAPAFEASAPEAVDPLPEEPAAEAPAFSSPDEVPARVARLAADAPLVEEFIGEDLPALLELAFVGGVSAARERRGRRAQDLLADASLRDDVLREARAWVEGYRAPALADGSEELVKVRSFFRTRLLRAS